MFPWGSRLPTRHDSAIYTSRPLGADPMEREDIQRTLVISQVLFLANELKEPYMELHFIKQHNQMIIATSHQALVTLVSCSLI